MIKWFAHLWGQYLKQGYIIGNNTNIDYDRDWDAEEEEEEKFAGAFK